MPPEGHLKVGFDVGQDAPRRVVGVLNDAQHAARRRDVPDGADHPVERRRVFRLVQMHHGDDGRAGLFREGRDRRQDLFHVGVLPGVLDGEIRIQRIDADEHGTGLRDCGAQHAEIAHEIHEPFAVLVLDALKIGHPVHIGLRRHESGLRGVLFIIFGVERNAVRARARRAVRPCSAGRDVRNEVNRRQGFALARVAHQQGQLAQRNAV